LRRAAFMAIYGNSEHDPEKWKPVFRKDHAPLKCEERQSIHPNRLRFDGAIMSDCLHCDINALVRERIEGKDQVDLADMVARVAESLAELIMMAPKDDWALLTAEAIRHLGNTIIEDSTGSGSDMTH
jgi:hypothetical protein